MNPHPTDQTDLHDPAGIALVCAALAVIIMGGTIVLIGLILLGVI